MSNVAYYNLSSYITDVLGVPCSPYVVHESATAPYIIYDRVGVENVMAFDGPAYSKELIEYTIYSNTVANAEFLKEQLIGLLNGYQHEVSVVMDSITNGYDEQESLYWVSVTFEVLIGVAAPSPDPVGVVAWDDVINKPEGLVSSSAQLPTSSADWSTLANIPTGLVSSSAQVDYNSIQNKPTLSESASYADKAHLADTASYATNVPAQSWGSITGKPIVVSSSAQIDYNNVSNVPAGIVSASSQIDFADVSNVPTGLVSASVQIDYNDVSNVPVGIVSSSAQIGYNAITGVPANIISSSAQFDAGDNVTFGVLTADVINVDTIYVRTITSSTAEITGSAHIMGDVYVGGTIFGNATSADIATTSSYVATAQSALTANSATTAVTANTASYVLNAVSSSYAADTQLAYDIKRMGFVNPAETTFDLQVSVGVWTFSLVKTGASWSYYWNGRKYTILNGKSVDLNVSGTPPVNGTTFYIVLNNATGTIAAQTTPWTLDDNVLPVATIRFNLTLNPQWLIADERHTVGLDRTLHRINHFTQGAKYISGGALDGPTLTTYTDAANALGIAETVIADEDLFLTLPVLSRPTGTTNAYLTSYRSGSAATWIWGQSSVPFYYSGSNAIAWDNNGVMTAAVNGDRVNSYIIFTDVQGQGRYTIVPGRAVYSSAANAQTENPLAFDWTGFPIAEAVIAYQLTWRVATAQTNRGKCQLEVAPKRINVSATTTISSGGNIAHNTLANIDGGDGTSYYHLSAAQYNTLGVSASYASSSTYAETASYALNGGGGATIDLADLWIYCGI